VTLRSGQAASGFLPVRYPGSEAAADPRARLARITDWVDGPAGAAGVGQRMFVGDEGQAFDLLSLRLLKLA
jgi:type VI secretion system protein ImpE